MSGYLSLSMRAWLLPSTLSRISKRNPCEPRVTARHFREQPVPYPSAWQCLAHRVSRRAGPESALHTPPSCSSTGPCTVRGEKNSPISLGMLVCLGYFCEGFLCTRVNLTAPQHQFHLSPCRIFLVLAVIPHLNLNLRKCWWTL